MRILRQVLILLGVWLAGELISRGLGLPIPGNVIGMFLLLALLQCRVIQVTWLTEITGFFLDNISFFFIPGAVALIVYFDQIKSNLAPMLVSIVVSTVAVFLVTGWSVQALLGVARRRRDKKKGGGPDAPGA